MSANFCLLSIWFPIAAVVMLILPRHSRYRTSSTATPPNCKTREAARKQSATSRTRITLCALWRSVVRHSSICRKHSKPPAGLGITLCVVWRIVVSHSAIAPPCSTFPRSEFSAPHPFSKRAMRDTLLCDSYLSSLYLSLSPSHNWCSFAPWDEWLKYL